MKNRKNKYKIVELILKIWIGFLFLTLIFLIWLFIHDFGFDFLKSEFGFENQKSRIEIQDSDYLSGCNVEASGYAGNWDGNFDIENENQILDLAMVEYSRPRFFNLTETERKTIQYIVAGEAKGESMEGKMAVAQCILHGMVKSGWSAERVRIEYKYSGWDDELEKSNPEAWAEVIEAVSRVFDDGELISDKPILYFYAPKYSSGEWHETLEFSFELSGHRFFYLKEDESADWFLNLRKDV